MAGAVVVLLVQEEDDTVPDTDIPAVITTATAIELRFDQVIAEDMAIQVVVAQMVVILQTVVMRTAVAQIITILVAGMVITDSRA